MPDQLAPVRSRPAPRVAFGGVSVGKAGVKRVDLRDPYYLAVALSWPRFLLLLLGVEAALNVGFAALYMIHPGSIAGAHPGSLFDAFFFSVETLATVGYGEMYPATRYGHVVAGAEIWTGMMFTAVSTGLLFVRVSRPKPCFRFADRAVLTSHQGRPTLMFRLASGRLGLLYDASARMSVLVTERTAEGQTYRSVSELRLRRAHLPVFPLTWTLMHDIDEASPLHGLDAEGMRAAGMRFFLTIEARDPALAAVVYDMRGFAPDAICFGMRYADALWTDADGRPTADLSRLSDVEPETAVEGPISGWTDEVNR